MEALYQRAERPYETRGKEKPQDAFQKSVAALLTLSGFRALDLGKDDKLIHAETLVERATVDIIAFNDAHNILLLGACTINPPKGEDFERLLHARAILQNLLPPDTRINLIPVLFSGQENISPFKGEARERGMHIINSHQLARLRKFIEDGKEDQFIRAIEWPYGLGVEGWDD